MAQIRKIYLDTRFRTSGSHAEATFELPVDVEANPQLSVVLGGLTFVNSMETVWAGNNQLYWLMHYNRHVQAGINRNLYFTITDPAGTTVGRIEKLDQKIYTYATLANELLRIVQIYIPQATVYFNGSQTCVITVGTGPTDSKLYFPSSAQIRDPNWPWPGTTYDINDPQDWNATFLSNNAPDLAPFAVMNLAPLPLVQRNVATLNDGMYDGATLADELHRVMGRYVTYDEKTGTLAVDTGDNDGLLNFPVPDQLRSASWRAENWPDLPQNPRAFNGALNPPSGFARLVKTDNLDLQTVREVYLHSSLCSNTSLSPSGQTDVLARVPIDVAWGTLQTFRPYSQYDIEAVRLTQGSLRNIRMILRDAFGVIVPLSHAVTYELTIIDTPM